jgi:DNA-binding winged helix-turn-helix (wHTH) protein
MEELGKEECVLDEDRDAAALGPQSMAAGENTLALGPFWLVSAQRLLLKGDKPVCLGGRALQILIVLLERPGESVSKEQLMGRVWPNIFVELANLTVHISALRRALRDGCNGSRFIINGPGCGYSFVAPVELRREADIGADNARRRADRPPSRDWLHADRIHWQDQVR